MVNSYLIYTENYEISNVTVLQLRESLVQSLLLDMTFMKLKSDVREKPTGQVKRKFAVHKLVDKE